MFEDPKDPLETAIERTDTVVSGKTVCNGRFPRNGQESLVLFQTLRVHERPLALKAHELVVFLYQESLAVEPKGHCFSTPPLRCLWWECQPDSQQYSRGPPAMGVWAAGSQPLIFG